MRLQVSQLPPPETGAGPEKTQAKRRPITFTENEMLEIQDPDQVGLNHSVYCPSAASAAFSLRIVWRMLFAFALCPITFSTQPTPHAPVVRSRTGTLA